MLRATEDFENAITAFAQSNMQKNELMSAVKAHELAYAAVSIFRALGGGWTPETM